MTPDQIAELKAAEANETDYRFLALVRTALPALLEHVEAQRVEIDALQERIDKEITTLTEFASTYRRGRVRLRTEIMDLRGKVEAQRRQLEIFSGALQLCTETVQALAAMASEGEGK